MKDGFDDIPFKELTEMIGWIEPPKTGGEPWTVTCFDGDNFDCSSQEVAAVMASTEEIKTLLLEDKKRRDSFL